MSNAEHLIENAIEALAEGRDLEKALDSTINHSMLRYSGIQKDDMIRMACHVVYSLYEGLNPFDEHFDEVMEYYRFLKEQDHAPKYV